MFKYWLYKFGQFFVNRLPLSVSYKFAILLADLKYYFSFRDRKIVQDNLKHILPPGENAGVLAKEVFRNFGKYLVEFFRIEKMVTQDFIDQHVTIKNIEFIEQALEKGKGGILLTAHLGNWELGGALLSFLGYPITAIALPHKERPVNDLFNHQRVVRGIKVVPTHLAFKACCDALGKNELIALLADRDFGSKGKVLEFLGDKARIPKGAALFAQETQAPIIPIFLTRDEDQHFTLSVGEPIMSLRNDEELVAEGNTVRIMKKYTSVIENMIRRYPTQWLMFRGFRAS